MLSSLLLVGLLAMAICAAPTPSRAASIGVGISVGIAPPQLPVYAQPVCPGPGYIWTPGYWAYDPVNGYYWVPGIWAMPPTVGFLWTPGYWGWGGAAFIWHAGYWGLHVGFSGGINYGFGYNGLGYVGGYWRGGTFFYNRSVNNFGGARFANVYNRPVANHFAANRVSYNGGVGGLRTRPTSGEITAEHERHIAVTSLQRNHEMAAHNDRSAFASVNHGRPGVGATASRGEIRNSSAARSTGYSRFSSTQHGSARTPQRTAGNFSPSRSFNTRQHPKATRQSHSTSAPRYQASRGAAPSRHAPARSESQHNSRPSGGGGRSEPHGR